MTRLDCLPWWHNVLLAYPTTVIKSGCAVVSGNVQCDPESMRRSAEAQMRQLGWWKESRPLSLDAYSLGRYVVTEVGNRSVEEQVAVIEAAINQAKRRGVSPARLILTGKGPHNGYYGPIHPPSGSLDAPYGRWAASSKDPTVRSLLVADFVLRGESGNFAKGATTQWGLDILMNKGRDPNDFIETIARNDRHYWVGPLPGVDHLHTFLARKLSTAEAALSGRALIAQAKTWVAKGRPNWSGLSVCPRPIFGHAVDGLGFAVGLGAGLVLGLVHLGVVRVR